LSNIEQFQQGVQSFLEKDTKRRWEEHRLGVNCLWGGGKFDAVDYFWPICIGSSISWDQSKLPDLQL